MKYGWKCCMQYLLSSTMRGINFTEAVFVCLTLIQSKTEPFVMLEFSTFLCCSHVVKYEVIRQWSILILLGVAVSKKFFAPNKPFLSIQQYNIESSLNLTQPTGRCSWMVNGRAQAIWVHNFDPHLFNQLFLCNG